MNQEEAGKENVKDISQLFQKLAPHMLDLTGADALCDRGPHGGEELRGAERFHVEPADELSFNCLSGDEFVRAGWHRMQYWLQQRGELRDEVVGLVWREPPHHRLKDDFERDLRLLAVSRSAFARSWLSSRPYFASARAALRFLAGELAVATGPPSPIWA